MQLPLKVCQQFGQFAYQDKQQGVEAIAALQDFLEEYQEGSVSSPELQAKAVKIERNQAGIVMLAKSVKLLPNMQINLKALTKDAQERSKEATAASHGWRVVGGRLGILVTKCELASSHGARASFF